MYIHAILVLLASCFLPTLTPAATDLTLPVAHPPPAGKLVSARTEQAQLPLDHDKILDIIYFPDIRLSRGYKFTLATVTHDLEQSYGAESVVHKLYIWHDQRCLFSAQNWEGTPVPLTYGMVVEAIDVLAEWMQHHPNPVNIWVRQRGTRGRAIGFISLSKVLAFEDG